MPNSSTSFAQRQHLKYGRGEVVLDASYRDKSEVIVEALQAEFRSKDYTPPKIPRVAVEVMRLSRIAGVSFDDVIKLIETDGMLAAQLLRVAGSAAYGPPKTDLSLHGALVRVGLKGIHDLVLDAAMGMLLLKAKSCQRHMEALLAHGQATARICRVVSQYTPIDADNAFAAGLLHDIGMVACFIVLAKQKKASDEALTPDVAHAIFAVHEQAARHIVQVWGLPAELGYVIGHHHLDPESDEPIHPLASTIRIAEAYADDSGFASPVAEPERMLQASFKQACAQLNLNDQQLTLIEQEAAQVCEGLRSEAHQTTRE